MEVELIMNLQGVEIGFAFMKKSVLDLLPDANVNFEKVVYPVLSEKKAAFRLCNGPSVLQCRIA